MSTFWLIEHLGYNEEFPCEFRSFDKCEEFRRIRRSCGILYVDETLRMLVAVDWLLERDWELDLSRCDDVFLSVYPVTAEVMT